MALNDFIFGFGPWVGGVMGWLFFYLNELLGFQIGLCLRWFFIPCILFLGFWVGLCMFILGLIVGLRPGMGPK